MKNSFFGVGRDKKCSKKKTLNQRGMDSWREGDRQRERTDLFAFGHILIQAQFYAKSTGFPGQRGD